MSVTFYSKKEAMEYARQKAKEGWAIDICGGEKGDYKYIVTLHKKVKRPKKGSGFSPYITTEEVYSQETNNSMLKRLRASGARKLRTKAEIVKRAKELFRKQGFKKVDVEIKDIGDRDGIVDMNIELKGDRVNLTVHPIHQYTTATNLKESLWHEVDHVTK